MLSGWSAWLCVALGGALGSLARVGTISLVGAKLSHWGVAAVNLLGAFGFAVVFGLTLRTAAIELPIKAFLLSGFMGAFTTFSTFTFETVQMWQAGAWFSGLLYIGVNVLGALLAFFLGAWLIGYPAAG